MFARKVSMHLKVEGAADFKKKIEGQVIPLLRKQESDQSLRFCGCGRGPSS